MSYLSTMTSMLADNQGREHEKHIYDYERLTREMIEELVPQIVKNTLNDTYMELWLKLRMIFEGKEVYFNDVADYVISEIKNELEKALNNS